MPYFGENDFFGSSPVATCPIVIHSYFILRLILIQTGEDYSYIPLNSVPYVCYDIIIIKMDFLREIVGGPKNRYKEFGYNLDLTYITRRVIAMAFPASGIEKLYRNSVDSIKELLENAHQNKYITINISGRNIEEEKLQNVTSYDW